MAGPVVAPIVGVGCLVFCDDSRILIGYRNKRNETPSWCFPGGLLEPGETFIAAAVRELEEETGLIAFGRPEILGFAQNLEAPVPFLTGGVVLYLSDPLAKPEVTEPHVFSCWEWRDIQALPQPLFPASEALVALFLGMEPPEHWVSYGFRPSGK